ncbi:sigma-70 family RNA polymerase sigma factor [Psychrobacillus sp. MER TA 171]|nr:sigma-70 family RNA polymerase sigma factor [Psychrobacillus sp. MER TA 171]
MFNKAIQEPTSYNEEKLNTSFARYYRKVKIINYISNLIYYYSIDFDKKLSKNSSRQLLILDSSTKSDGNDLNSVNKDFLLTSKEDLTYKSFNNNNSIKEQIINQNIYYALSHLSPKQLKILDLIYSYNCSNKEVAKILNESEQTISYNHKKAIEKLRNRINKERKIQ